MVVSAFPQHHKECHFIYKRAILEKGSSWGAGTFAGTDGSRQPSPLELEIASLQGKGFWETVAKYHGDAKSS
jgi:multimeric flavodoxin WrbA